MGYVPNKTAIYIFQYNNYLKVFIKSPFGLNENLNLEITNYGPAFPIPSPSVLSKVLLLKPLMHIVIYS